MFMAQKQMFGLSGSWFMRFCMEKRRLPIAEQKVSLNIKSWLPLAKDDWSQIYPPK